MEQSAVPIREEWVHEAENNVIAEAPIRAPSPSAPIDTAEAIAAWIIRENKASAETEPISEAIAAWIAASSFTQPESGEYDESPLDYAMPTAYNFSEMSTAPTHDTEYSLDYEKEDITVQREVENIFSADKWDTDEIDLAQLEMAESAAPTMQDVLEALDNDTKPSFDITTLAGFQSGRIRTFDLRR